MIKTRALIHLWVVAVLALGALLLLFIANPNRLAHDQIDHKIFLMTYAEPDQFAGDYLLGTPKRALVDNRYSFQFIGWLANLMGSDELVRWVLVAPVFFVFAVGMYAVCWYFTRTVLASLLTAVVANVHLVPVFVAEWGLPGPTELDPWTFAQAWYPLLFLLYYVGERRRDDRLILLSVVLAGVLGNLHIITAFNVIGIFLLTYVWLRRFRPNSLRRAFSFGLLAVATSLPYLLLYYGKNIDHVTAFDPANPNAWAAINAIAPHVTALGKLTLLRIWLVDYGYVLWPLLAVYVWIVGAGDRNVASSNVIASPREAILSINGIATASRGETPGNDSEQKGAEDWAFFRRLSVTFLLATLAFNAAFSLLQLFRLVVLHRLPMYNEPRGIQLGYIIFFIALGVLFARISAWVSRRLTFGWRIAGLLAVTVIGLGAVRIVEPTLAARYRAHLNPGYSWHTCDSQLYREFNRLNLPSGLVLQDPDFWSAFRICTGRPVVVQGRDRSFAYSLGSDTMLEWFGRYQEAATAFKTGGDTLLTTAKKYGARIIVSRFCISVIADQLSQRHEVSGEGCIYVTRE